MPEPYFSTPNATLYLGDARDVLPSFAKESFGLVVTDPPYGVAFQSHMRKEWFNPIANDKPSERAVVEEVLLHCVRLVGQNRHLYIAGPEVLRSQLDAKVSEPTELIWVKQDGPGMGNLRSPWSASHEPWNFYTSLHRHGGERGKSTLAGKMRKGSVLTFMKPTGTKVRHPSEKPLNLCASFIESSSNVGDSVLDPFAGVGSTGVAAVLLGRTTVMCELEEQYAEIAAERLEKAESIRAQSLAA